MESLFEVLYQYAVENCYGPLSPEEREEQERCNDMLAALWMSWPPKAAASWPNRWRTAQSPWPGWASAACSGPGCPSAWR